MLMLPKWEKTANLILMHSAKVSIRSRFPTARTFSTSQSSFLRPKSTKTPITIFSSWRKFLEHRPTRTISLSLKFSGASLHAKSNFRSLVKVLSSQLSVRSKIWLEHALPRVLWACYIRLHGSCTGPSSFLSQLSTRMACLPHSWLTDKTLATHTSTSLSSAPSTSWDTWSQPSS